MIERLPPAFVARPLEHEAVLGLLFDSPPGSLIAITPALRGAGGYGTTTLAQALCHDPRLRQAFPDGILWATLGEAPGNLIDHLDAWIYQLQGTPARSPSVEVASETLRGLLAPRTMLLVIDNLWHLSHLHPFLQAAPHCTWLITARDSNIVPPGSHIYHLGPMQETDAIQLLGEGLGDYQPRALAPLATTLDGWPILLALANAILRTGQHPPDALSQSLRAQGLLPLDVRRPENRALAITSLLSLALSGFTPQERARYYELAIFPPDVDIPLSTIATVWQQTGQLDQAATTQLCARFVAAALMHSPSSDPHTVRLHAAIRASLRQRLGSTLVAAHDAFLAAYSLPHWSQIPPTDSYLWRHLAYHLHAAGQSETLRALLLDFEWLQAKLIHTDIHTLLEDYHWLSNDALLAVEQALAHAAPIVINHPDQLGAQLLAHLPHTPGPLQTLRAQIIQQQRAPWLRPLSPPLSTAPTEPQDASPTAEGPNGHPGPVIVQRRPLAPRLAYPQEDHHLPDLSPHLTLVGHTDLVSGVALTPDSRLAVSASSDKTVRVWELHSGQERLCFTGHGASAYSVVVTPEGQRAISASWEHLKIWDIGTGQEYGTLAGHTNRVNCVALSPDGQIAVSGSFGERMKVWDIASCTCLHTLAQHHAAVLSVAITPDGQHLLSASADHTVRLWHLPTGECQRVLKGHTDWVSAVAVTPDGRHAISASGDWTLKLWSLATGQPRLTFTGHTDQIYGVAITPDGRYAISASWDHTLKIWDLSTGQQRLTLQGHTSGVKAVAITPDGRYILSASWDGTIKVWAYPAAELMTPPVAAPVQRPNSRAVAAPQQSPALPSKATLDPGPPHPPLVISPDGRYALTTGNHALCLWALDTGQLCATIPTPPAPITALAITPDGLTIVAACEKVIHTWDLTSHQPQQTLAAHQGTVTSMAVTPDSRYLVSAGWDGLLAVWELAGGQQVAAFHTVSPLYSCALAPDGETIGVTDQSNRLLLFRLERALLPV